MPASVDLYGTAYGNFAKPALEQVRRETYGEDFGPSNRCNTEEYRLFIQLLNLTAADHVLDVGCGSGGPAMFLGREAGCRVTGVDLNEGGLRGGLELVRKGGMQERVDFRQADIRQSLPFADEAFDAIVSMD